MNDNQVTVTLLSIPKEVADAIESLRSERMTNSRICAYHLGTGPYDKKLTQTLRSIAFDTLLSALINGYAVEKFAEEMEQEAYDNIRWAYEVPTATEAAEGFNEGNKFTLNTLGIKIEGVNA